MSEIDKCYYGTGFYWQDVARLAGRLRDTIPSVERRKGFIRMKLTSKLYAYSISLVHATGTLVRKQKTSLLVGLSTPETRALMQEKATPISSGCSLSTGAVISGKTTSDFVT